MSNSSLATYIDSNNGNYNSRTSYISKIVIHSAFAVGDCRTLSEIAASTPSGSFNYGIGNDGQIGLYIQEMHRSWSTGNPENDNISVSIMMCNASVDANMPVTAAAYESLIKLCVDICRRNFILELKYSGDPRTSNLVIHDMFARIDCPGKYLKSKLKDIVNRVNFELSHPRLAESETYALMSQSNIVVDAISPYVAIVDEGSFGINYSNLRTAGVVGVMFCAGSYFDANHKKRSSYINSSLKRQVSELSSSYLPYALYCEVRAKSVSEAVLECNQLYYVISKYPPKLGLWLSIHFATTSIINNKVIEKYYQNIVKWGLKSKCGIYCDKSELAKISWKDMWCDKFSLWIVAKMSGLSNLHELETPNFFKLENM